MPQHPSLTVASAGFPKGQRPFGHSAAKKSFLGFAEALFFSGVCQAKRGRGNAPKRFVSRHEKELRREISLGQ